jgi:hypothetical protein
MGYVAAVLLASGCGGSTGALSPAAPSPAALHAEIGDPVGDALADPSARVSPDLTHATIDVANGSITVAIRFAPAAFDPATARVTVQLDTDQNPSTGIRQANGMGVEYVIDMPAFSSQANVLKAVPNAACTTIDPCYVPAGTVPLSVSSDGMTAAVPLPLLGNADGRMMFRVIAYVSLPGVASAYTDDAMPDMTLPPAHVP